MAARGSIAGGGDEVGRMIVRLMGDGSSYFRMLLAAEKGIARTAAFITRVGKRIQSLGRTMALRFTAPILGMGAAVFKFGSDFEAEMSKIVGLVGVAQEQVDAWSKDLIALGPKLSKTPIELARALFFVTSAGFRGAEAIDVLTQAAKASAGGMGETAVIADALTSAVNAYGKDVLSAAMATDILVAAVREGKLEAASLAPVLGQILPMASKMEVSFADVAGALAVMSKTGTNATEGATALQSLLVTLQKPADESRRVLKGVGISFQQLRDMAKQPGGLIEIMRLLERTFKDDEEALATIIPNIRALRGTMNILAQDASDVDSVMQGVRNAVGATDDAFEAAEKTVRFRFNKAISSLQGLLITLGTTVLPMVATGLEHVERFFDKLAKLWENVSPAAKRMTVIVAGLIAVIGPALILLGGLIVLSGIALGGFASLLGVVTGTLATVASVVSAIFTPVGLLTAAVVGLGIAILHWTDLGGKALTWFGKQWGALVEHVRPAMEGIKAALEVNDIALAWKISWTQIKLTFFTVVKSLRELWAGFVFVLTNWWVDAMTVIQEAWQLASNTIAKGLVKLVGLLPEAAGGTTEEETKAILKQLDLMNAVALKRIRKLRTDLKGEAQQALGTTIEEISNQIKELEKTQRGLVGKAIDRAVKSRWEAWRKAWQALDDPFAIAKKDGKDGDKDKDKLPKPFAGRLRGFQAVGLQSAEAAFRQRQHERGMVGGRQVAVEERQDKKLGRVVTLLEQIERDADAILKAAGLEIPAANVAGGGA